MADYSEERPLSPEGFYHEAFGQQSTPSRDVPRQQIADQLPVGPGHDNYFDQFMPHPNSASTQQQGSQSQSRPVSLAQQMLTLDDWTNPSNLSLGLEHAQDINTTPITNQSNSTRPRVGSRCRLATITSQHLW
jgi:hypothetical protein